MTHPPAPWYQLARRLRAPHPPQFCEECRHALPLFITDELADRPVDTLYPAVAAHLDLCLDCIYEYEALANLIAAALHQPPDTGKESKI